MNGANGNPEKNVQCLKNESKRHNIGTRDAAAEKLD